MLLVAKRTIATYLSISSTSLGATWSRPQDARRSKRGTLAI